MGKARDLFKKIRDAKGTCHAKMGTVKNRNCMDLTDMEDIKKSWQEYTEELQETGDNRGQDGITDSTDTSFTKFRQMVKDREAWSATVHGVTKSWTQLSD